MLRGIGAAAWPQWSRRFWWTRSREFRHVYHSFVFINSLLRESHLTKTQPFLGLHSPDGQHSARRTSGNFLSRLLFKTGVLPKSHNQQIIMIFLCRLDDSVSFIPIDEFGIEQEASGLRFLTSHLLAQCVFCPCPFNPLFSWQRRNIPRKVDRWWFDNFTVRNSACNAFVNLIATSRA